MRREMLLGLAAAGTLAPLALGRRGFAAWPVAHALLLYPTLRRNCQWFGPVVTCFETPRREVWLTIDDGPDADDTPRILDQLARFGAKATFFMIGRKVEQMRDLVWEACRAGHGIGNHSYSHPSAWFWALGSSATRREIERGRDAIVAATGAPPEGFRSPVGMTNAFVHTVLGNAAPIGWSVSGLDGLGDRGAVVVDRVMRGVHPGAIICVHEGGGAGRVETIAGLLERLTDEGYRCVIPAPATFR